MPRRQCFHRVAERMYAAVPCRMDEMHRPLRMRIERGTEHRERRCDADAADQHERPVTAFEPEIARRWIQFDDVACPDIRVQMVRRAAISVRVSR